VLLGYQKVFKDTYIIFTMKDTKDYRLRDIDVKLWERFKGCLRKVYWKEGITINDGIMNLIREFIDKYESEGYKKRWYLNGF